MCEVFLWFMNLFSMVSKRACWLCGGEIVCDNCCGIVLMYMLIRKSVFVAKSCGGGDRVGVVL